jgi:glycosyltransferase involved in cell wall biosynthesis
VRAVRRTALHFTDTRGFGGAEKSILFLVERLAAHGWQSLLVHHDEPDARQLVVEAEQLGARTLNIPRMTDRHALVDVARFVRLVRSLRPEVFHAHLTWPLACEFGLVGAGLARLPAVVATHQLYLDVPGRRARIVPRLVWRGVDRHIAVSESVAQSLREELRVEARKITVVPNGVPLVAEADGHGVTREKNAPSVVLTTAQLRAHKGHEYLLEAAQQIPTARFLFVGDGPERDRLENLARSLGVHDRVEFLGFRSDVGELVQRCDVFVLPSLDEGLPLAVLEAMTAGKPVVVTRAGGTSEAVVDGVTGIVVEPRDPAALADAVRAVLADPELAARIGAAGRARVRTRFSAEGMGDAVAGVYEELLGSRRGGR